GEAVPIPPHMSAARHAAKPRAKFMLGIMAFVSRCRLLLGPARARGGPFRELASEVTRHRGPRTRALGDRTWFEKSQDSRARLACLAPFPGRSINQACRDFHPLSSFLTMPLRRFLTIPS